MCTSTIYFLILNFELILFSFYLFLNLIILSKYFLLSRALHGHNTSIYINTPDVHLSIQSFTYKWKGLPPTK